MLKPTLGLLLLTAAMVILTSWEVPVRPSPADAVGAREVARIRAHLIGAERLAAGRDLSGLSPSQRSSRGRLLRVLRAYREGGRFPRNHDFPGRRVPYFVDRDGTRCAMAYLIESTGDSAMVTRIARSRNNAYVRDLADDPDLLAWLDRNGLTVAEAARIQPSYGYQREHSSAALEPVAIAAVMGLETSGILLNLDPPRTQRARAWRGSMAVVSGFGGMIAGASLLDKPGDLSQGWGASVLTLGAVSLIHGIHRLAQQPRPGQSAWIEATPWRSSQGAPGLAFRMRF